MPQGAEEVDLVQRLGQPLLVGRFQIGEQSGVKLQQGILGRKLGHHQFHQGRVEVLAHRQGKTQAVAQLGRAGPRLGEAFGPGGGQAGFQRRKKGLLLCQFHGLPPSCYSNSCFFR